MHQPAVVGDRDTGRRQEVDGVLQPRPAGQVDDLRRLRRDVSADRRVPGRAEHDHREIAPQEVGGEGGVALGRPALGRPELGARHEADKVPSGQLVLVEQTRAVVMVDAEARGQEFAAAGEPLEHVRGLAPVAFGAGHDVVQKAVTEFAAIAGPPRDPGEERHERGLPASLEDECLAVAARQRPADAEALAKAEPVRCERRRNALANLGHASRDRQRSRRGDNVDRLVGMALMHSADQCVGHDHVADPARPGYEDGHAFSHSM